MRSSRTVIFLDHLGAHGGGQLGLFRLLEKRGSDLTPLNVVFLQGGDIAERLEQLGVSVKVLFAPGPRPSVAASVSSLRRLFRGQEHSILVVANSLRAALIAALTPLPRSSLACYVREDVSRTSLGLLKSTVFGWLLLPRFGTLIANSQSTRRSLCGPRWNRNRAEVVYPVSGVKSSNTEVLRSDLELKRDMLPFRVVSLSRLQRWKGVDILIKAVAQASLLQPGAIELTIAGGGDMSDPTYERELHELASDVDVPVAFVGHVDDITQVLNPAHLLCVCSRTPEAFGQVVPQAMAHGVAVVSPPAGGPPEILLATGAGLVVESNDVRGFARAIAGLAADRNRWSQLAKAGLSASKLLSDDVTASSMVEVLTRAREKYSAQ